MTRNPHIFNLFLNQLSLPSKNDILFLSLVHTLPVVRNDPVWRQLRLAGAGVFCHELGARHELIVH